MAEVLQKIDLYAQLEPPVQKPLTLMATSVALCLVVLGYGVTLIVYWVAQHDLDARIAAERQKNDSLQAVIRQKQDKDNSIDLSSLEAELIDQRHYQKQQEFLVQYLRDPAINQAGNFSKVLAGLARQHVSGIAVEKFSMHHLSKQLTMHGQLSDPRALPRYVSKLGSEDVFTDMTFEKIAVATLNDQLSFELMSSRAADGESGI